MADRKPSFSDTAEQRPDRRASRQANGRDEERKRGQRLFGALLGTLSQRSNTAAQKRRADIERKQQDKLKLQDEEYDELKKKKREERAAIRKKEQRYYEEESVSACLPLSLRACSLWLVLIDANPALESVGNGTFFEDKIGASVGML